MKLVKSDDLMVSQKSGYQGGTLEEINGQRGLVRMRMQERLDSYGQSSTNLTTGG